MAEQPSKSFDATVREKWDQLELVFQNRTGNSESPLEIGVVIPRVRNNGQAMNTFAFCLGQLFSDAYASDAEFKVFETQEVMILVAIGMMWAKRMVAMLLSWGIEFHIDENVLDNLEHAMGTREMKFGWSDYN